jgi:hypothetical protein
MDSTGKKPLYKRWWVWGLGVFILVIIASNGSGGSNGGSTTNNVVQGTEASDTTNEAKAEPTWQAVKTWTGNGIKKTEPFTITGEQWRVTWTNKGGYLGVSVYKPGNTLPTEMLVNTTDATSDTSYVYKDGEFYLDVNSSGAWELTVEELK